MNKKNDQYMSQLPDNWINGYFGRGVYLILSALVSAPIYLAIEAYVRSIDVHKDEAVAAVATGCFIAGVFAGRYIAQIWSAGKRSIPNTLLIGLIILIVANISWLFFHADFPLEGRAAINLLLFWLPFVIVSLALGILIKLIRTVTQNQLQEAQTSAANSQSELQLLQSQLSPHFLFNTLNNLYGLSISQHEKIPPLLLKLSDLLRYSVYDVKETFVPLIDELAYINNYIDFEKIRIGDRLELSIDIENVVRTDIKIAPMLLIVFIENAFKHSKNTTSEKIFIEIALKTWGKMILFSLKNSYNKPKLEPANSGGLGLENVNKRLALLYPVEHVLDLQTTDDFYTVSLQLKMK
ncbi:sensor histidine kinase [Spirosoma endophyticum]|uniref:GHKL domain-containing protein n=1 Tax=Spirosoma endophyticum TaxID=662367 RepID=A0A1I1PXE1_9BACT|nr:histidine kinase [Spirosoma endophyticum]SFD14499.1 GHKL domain-containing protein [Spirosoma endophyticum]